MTIYLDDFETWKDIQQQFCTTYEKPDEVYIAQYRYEDYSGHSEIYFRNNGKYYYNQASHCSCYGLENQFDPEEFDTIELYIEWLQRKIETDYYTEHAKKVLKKVKKEKKSLENLSKLV